MKRLAVLFILVASLAFSQTASDLNSGLILTQESSEGSFTLSWWGELGREYYVQQSEDLVRWRFLPVAEQGYNAPITWGLSTNAERMFFKITHVPSGPNSPQWTDSDGDGLSNWDETQGGTNPFNQDSDGDGWYDDEENRMGNDPLNAENKPTLKPVTDYVEEQARTIRSGYHETGGNTETTYWQYQSPFEEPSFFGTWYSTWSGPTLLPVEKSGMATFSDFRPPLTVESVSGAREALDQIYSMSEGWRPNWGPHSVTSSYSFQAAGTGGGYPPYGEYSNGATWETSTTTTTQESWDGGVSEVRLAWKPDAPRPERLSTVTKTYVKVVKYGGEVQSLNRETLTLPPGSPSSNTVGIRADTTVQDGSWEESLHPVELMDIKSHENTNDDVTIAKWDTAQKINESNIAWIDAHTSEADATPRMPQLELRIPGLQQGLTVEAKLEVQYNRGNGQRTGKNQPEDRVRIPQNGSYQTISGLTWKIWESYPNQPFFGGDATLTYRIMDGQDPVLSPQTVQFRIGGKNPEAARAKVFIESLNNAGPQGPLWFAYAIAKTESKDYNGTGTRYNQFWQLPRDEKDTANKTSRQTHAGRPVWSPDDSDEPGGYGLFQVTGTAADDQANISSQQIWNWQENVRGGLAIIETKRADADVWMTRQRNANNANGVALPSLTVRNVTFAEGTDRTMNHAVTIKSWNGASKPPASFTDPEPVPPGFIIDTRAGDYFCYWKNAAPGPNKWALNRYNLPPGDIQPFNYVDRVCQEVE